MLIVDVSKTIGGLAEAINKKSAELANLEEEYRSKLEVLNRYISKIEQDSAQESSIMKSQEEILRLISTPVNCPKCLHEIYNPENDSDYVLIPKAQIEILKDERVHHKNQTVKGKDIALSDNLTENKPAEQYLPESKSKKNKLKKTCSYCNKTGHSRARCFARLTTPVESTNPKKIHKHH